MRSLPLLSLLGAALLGPVLAAPTLPKGYVRYHSVQLDFDGDGREETATAMQWDGFTVGHAPRLWITRGDRVLLDLWLKDTNALSAGNAVPHEALQFGDLTGDGTADLLFLPSSAGGSGGTQFVRVVYWNGKDWANLRLANRAFPHLCENDGAVLRRSGRGRGVLWLYRLVLKTNRYQAQRFTYRGGMLVGGPVQSAARRGKAGLRELGLT